MAQHTHEPAAAAEAATDNQPAVVTKAANSNQAAGNQAAGNTTAGGEASGGEACCSTCYRFWSCSRLPCRQREKILSWERPGRREVLTVMEDPKAPPLPASKTVVRDRAGGADKAAANTADNTTTGSREAGNQVILCRAGNQRDVLFSDDQVCVVCFATSGFKTSRTNRSMIMESWSTK